MKYIHLSDLHLGKRVNEVSMRDEQEKILAQILDIIDTEHPDGVLIAGDVYDKSVPPAEAVTMFDAFLVKLASRQVQTFLISGNHDSPERLSFGGRIMAAEGIHVSPVYDGHVAPIAMTDACGTVNVYLLPFLKPMHVRRFFPETEIVTYTDALRKAIAEMQVDPTVRNILVTHQFVTGSATCESEELSVGGTDNVDASVFAPFDYVALGHLHTPQNCGSVRIRYCGTPLKYSFSEENDQKSVTVVELAEKEAPLTVRTVPLTPIHDMAELRGTFAELTDSIYVQRCSVRDCYLRITLTDELDIPDAVSRLRLTYPNLMHLRYDNARTRAVQTLSGAADAEHKSSYELFAEFYEQQNGAPMSDEQSAYLKTVIETIEEERR